jgi:hypothetical protein
MLFRLTLNQSRSRGLQSLVVLHNCLLADQAKPSKQ